jgi:hypothetical protein
VPVEVRSSRKMALAMRWLIDSARKRGENTMPKKLAAELIDARKTVAAPSRSAKKPTAWPKPTRHSPTTAGEFDGLVKQAGQHHFGACCLAVPEGLRQSEGRRKAAFGHPEIQEI